MLQFRAAPVFQLVRCGKGRKYNKPMFPVKSHSAEDYGKTCMVAFNKTLAFVSLYFPMKTKSFKCNVYLI